MAGEQNSWILNDYNLSNPHAYELNYRYGKSTAECGTGCQSGDCICQSSISASSTSTTTETPLPSPFLPSPDGTYGYWNKYKCTGAKCNYGNCRSQEGFCGTSSHHCDDLLGCQPEFGLYDKTVILTKGGEYVSSLSQSRVSTTAPLKATIQSSIKSITVAKKTPRTTSKTTPNVAVKTTPKK
ncbi:hypothetical protein TWF694_005305 [Orbilia ellipsospora]|uniref:Chitin-binding type-1 domain-containing protein n=1 Tax=Orbilia ellipsospora TaxID=2528407 RepID=A0AAV9WTT5_9PEZI